MSEEKKKWQKGQCDHHCLCCKLQLILYSQESYWSHEITAQALLVFIRQLYFNVLSPCTLHGGWCMKMSCISSSMAGDWAAAGNRATAAASLLLLCLLAGLGIAPQPGLPLQKRYFQLHLTSVWLKPFAHWAALLSLLLNHLILSPIKS